MAASSPPAPAAGFFARASVAARELAAAASAASVSSASPEAASARAAAAAAGVRARCRSRAAACLDLCRMARGESFFFDSAVVSAGAAPCDAQLPRQWAVAVASLGRLEASLGAGAGEAAPALAEALLRAAAQLMAEYEHWRGDTLLPDALRSLAVRGAVPAAGGGDDYGGGSGGGGDEHFPSELRGARPGDPVRASLHATAHAGVVYEVLLPLPAPFAELGVREVVTALCEALQALYAALDAGRDFAGVPNAADALARLDRRIDKYFLRPVVDMLLRAAQLEAQRAARQGGAADLAAAAAALRRQADALEPQQC